jgi:hypothetical protein
MAEDFLKRVIAFEEAPATTNFVPGDEPYADELLVVMPGDARRDRVFELIEEIGKPDTIDGDERIIDQGQQSMSLWWD